MGKPTGFLEYERRDRTYLPVEERVRSWREFVVELPQDELARQGGRCMDCGIPFCHEGCPVHNVIPDWNDLVYGSRWHEALDALHSTNNFPEVTGRVCPAPCEEACTLNLDDRAVTIKTIECSIADRGFRNGWVRPQPAARRTGRRVAVVGSGPSGLACAQQLARAGHAVEVLEKSDRIGGLLRYGIPDFKMEKGIIERRMRQMEAEGVVFRPGVRVGGEGAKVSARALVDEFDAVVLAGGAEQPRDLPVEGRDLDGVHFAMEFLPQQNRRVAGDDIPEGTAITAKDKSVVVIGGGDTGSDCIGTSFRQGARSVTQLEILPRPPDREEKLLTWPDWPLKLRTSSSQAEGAKRDFSVTTSAIRGRRGRVEALACARVDWRRDEPGGPPRMVKVEGGGFDLPADLVLLAMGFLHPVHEGMLAELSVDLDGRGNVRAGTDDYRTSVDGVFACGDMRRGQSLVVWAIREGRQTARAVDEYLMGRSDLPR